MVNGSRPRIITITIYRQGYGSRNTRSASRGTIIVDLLDCKSNSIGECIFGWGNAAEHLLDRQAAGGSFFRRVDDSRNGVRTFLKYGLTICYLDRVSIVEIPISFGRLRFRQSIGMTGGNAGKGERSTILGRRAILRPVGVIIGSNLECRSRKRFIISIDLSKREVVSKSLNKRYRKKTCLERILRVRPAAVVICNHIKQFCFSIRSGRFCSRFVRLCQVIQLYFILECITQHRTFYCAAIAVIRYIGYIVIIA